MAFEKLNRDSEDSNIAFTKTSVLMRILVTTFVESVICVILGYGGYLVYKGQFNAGQLMEFIGYFNAVVWPIMAVADLIDMTSRGKASLKRISELLDAPKNVFDRPGVQELTDPRARSNSATSALPTPTGISRVGACVLYHPPRREHRSGGQDRLRQDHSGRPDPAHLQCKRRATVP